MADQIEADMDAALHDAFREMLLKVPEQKNIGMLVEYVWQAGVKAQRELVWRQWLAAGGTEEGDVPPEWKGDAKIPNVQHGEWSDGEPVQENV